MPVVLRDRQVCAALDQVTGDPGGSDVVVLFDRLLRVAATMATISAAAARTITMIPNVRRA